MTGLDFEHAFMRMPLAANIVDANLVFVAANDRYCQAVQRTREQLIGGYVFDVFPDTPERIQPVLEAYQTTLAGEITILKCQPFKLLLPSGELEDRLWDVEHQPVYAADGTITHLIQYCEDVTERELLRADRDLISAELNHRVRNTLSVVQSVAQHTGAGYDTIEDFLDSFSDRLESINRNFTALSKAHWRGLKLKDILENELTPFAGGALGRVEMDGPDITISVNGTKDLTLIVHELVTNASKHGFLSSPNGELKVHWQIDGNVLAIDWLETGLSGISEPDHTGFGFQLFDMIPHSKLEKTFADDGLKLHITLPVDLASDQDLVA